MERVTPVPAAYWLNIVDGKLCRNERGAQWGSRVTSLRLTANVTVSFFPSQFFPWGKNGPAHSFPGEKTDRSVFSPGERFDKSVFSPPSQFFPPMLFFRKRLENDICVVV